MSSTQDPSLEDNSSPYNYVPTRSVCIIFVALFALATLAHLGQAVRYRIWWLLPTAVLASIGETIGWSGRLWSSFSPTLQDPFLMQITTTIISPTPLVAANFVILGRIIQFLGTQYSRISPRLYTIIFCTADFVALVVQGAGGGIASTADDKKGSDLGGNIMLGGIIFQLVMIVLYVLLAAEFYFRYFRDLPLRAGNSSRREMDSKIKMMTGALGSTTLLLFIRSIYRVIELSDGWNGRIISTQVYFNVLDGAMVVVAIYILAFFHPGRLLPSRAEIFGEKNGSDVEIPMKA